MVDRIRLYKKWWSTWKTIPVLAWVKAAALYRDGNYQEAIQYYEKGLAKHRSHPARFCARMDLAYCLFHEKRYQEAEKHLKNVTTFFPRSKEAHLRLARLQMWTGRSLDAAWTMRRALRSITADPDVVALFMIAVLDNGGPAFLLKEVIEASLKLDKEAQQNLRLQAARARLTMNRGDKEKGREFLEKVASDEKAPLEALIIYAEVLLETKKVANARRYLKRALNKAPAHPRVLSMLAQSYLCAGPFYNAEYARQLATDACQNTGWLSPREMHILADAYYHLNDKISSLIIASKAKEEGSRLLGSYRGSDVLDKLIENLSAGTQA